MKEVVYLILVESVNQDSLSGKYHMESMTLTRESFYVVVLMYMNDRLSLELAEECHNEMARYYDKVKIRNMFSMIV